MNIFYLDKNPYKAACNLCDKHVIKMIVETAQMLSTAHRVLDGFETHKPSKSGTRLAKYWEHPTLDDILYKATHVNHPSNVWIRSGDKNYEWSYEHFLGLCQEYRRRYGKIHATKIKLGIPLANLPTNIPYQSTDIPLAMPEEYKCSDPIKAYRKYYQSKQTDMKMTWKETQAPGWFYEHIT